jgi:CheY-like chemotaxis protein
MKTAGSILIIDDEQAVRQLIRTVLDQFGYAGLMQAAGANEALEIARRGQTSIQLLISDIQLGSGMDGVQLANALTGLTPDLKVLLMSGRPKPHDLKPGWQFLAKPFSASELLVAVQQILGTSAVQFRQATRDLTVFTLDLKKTTIPAGAMLEDFRIGPGHEGLQPQNPNVASFHHGGEVLFNLAHEIINRTRLVSGTRSRYAA